ncbi:MAG: SDR family oxidoreductase [Candidatus Bathyarchaeota archaeon]
MSDDFSRILITGGAGFIGSHLVDRLIENGHTVRVIDNLSTGEKRNLNPHKNKESFQFIEGDIRDFNLVKKCVKDVDAVLHEAALVSVTRSLEDPVLSNEINIKGSLNLLKASVDANVQRFIYASSCAVYGDTEILPVSEKNPSNPLSPYAVDKLAVEKYAKIFNDSFEIETVGLRYFNVYGSRQKYGPYSGVISIFINKLLEDKAPTIFGDGEQTRDFVNVKDVIDANILALSKKDVAGKVFNISSGKAITINNILEIIKKILKKENIDPIYSESRLGDIKHSFADITKAQEILGYEPKIQIDKGLEQLIQFSLNQK